MTNLSTYQLFHLQGSNVKDFLQGQLCSDVNLLQNSQPQLTGICNAKGRLVASPFIILNNDNYYLALSNSMGDILLKYWKPYLMISRVQMLPIESPFDLDHLFAWQYLIDNKIVLIQPATSKAFMPITLGYEHFNALSFNKGCYVGQEILARIHFKGKVKRHVATVIFDQATEITANQAILDSNGKTVGHIALSTFDNQAVNTTLAVLMNQVDTNTLSLEDNTQLRIQ